MMLAYFRDGETQVEDGSGMNLSDSWLRPPARQRKKKYGLYPESEQEPAFTVTRK